MNAFHKWQNDERVARGWNERGTMEHHRKYIKGVMENPAFIPYVMSWDGELMGYVELVWIKVSLSLQSPEDKFNAHTCRRITLLPTFLMVFGIMTEDCTFLLGKTNSEDKHFVRALVFNFTGATHHLQYSICSASMVPVNLSLPLPCRSENSEGQRRAKAGKPRDHQNIYRCNYASRNSEYQHTSHPFLHCQHWRDRKHCYQL